MKHSDLKVGMEVKRVSNFDNMYFTSTEGNTSTVKEIIPSPFFYTEEDCGNYWDAKYFEPVQEIEEETKMKETSKISMDKKYKTRCGYPVRVLCVDMKNDWPVVCIMECPDGTEITSNVTIYGKDWDEEDSDLDLIEVSPWEDFKKDDKVVVSIDGVFWFKRYFSHVENDKPCTFPEGGTSWSSPEGSTQWNYCRKPTKEELEG